eukprot:7177961-Pyramimonas_sp.AAC.1
MLRANTWLRNLKTVARKKRRAMMQKLCNKTFGICSLVLPRPVNGDVQLVLVKTRPGDGGTRRQGLVRATEDLTRGQSKILRARLNCLLPALRSV